jgi:hypothetical protein
MNEDQDNITPYPDEIRWAPVSTDPLPSFPAIAFPIKSKLRAMMKAGGNSLIYENKYVEPVHRNEFPYDVYGRVRTLDHELIIDDIDMEGNVQSRSSMILGLATDCMKAFFAHINDKAALDLFLKSAVSSGHEGVIVRPLESKFGDPEYVLKPIEIAR